MPVLLMNALKALYQQNQSTPLTGTLTETQTGNLSTNVVPLANTAYSDLNALTAQNGDTYTALKNDVTNQQSMQNLYTGFVSDIEDADMATALTNLSSNQTALQAVLTVTSKLNDLTLLNYLPTSG